MDVAEQPVQFTGIRLEEPLELWVVGTGGQPKPAQLVVVPVTLVAELLGHALAHCGRPAPEVVGVLVHHRPVHAGERTQAMNRRRTEAANLSGYLPPGFG